MVAKRSSGLRRGRRRDVRSSQQAQDRPEVKRNERENPWQFRGSQERQGQGGPHRLPEGERVKDYFGESTQGMPFDLI